MTRPAAAIRADLEHPHTAALLAVRASVGDGPIGRLLRDVGPLLDRLAAVERERDELRERLGECIGCNYNDGPDECCPQHGRSVSEWIEIASNRIGTANAAIARAEAAERECATLHDALDGVRATADDALSTVRERDQAKAWAQVAEVVDWATAPEPLLCSSVAPRLAREQPTMCALPLNHGGRHYEDADPTPDSTWWMP